MSVIGRLEIKERGVCQIGEREIEEIEEKRRKRRTRGR